MPRRLYHATDHVNVRSIEMEGIKTTGGLIYLADSKPHALRFMVYRNADPVAFFQVDPSRLHGEITRSHDHSEIVFGCKAWYYEDDIPPEALLTRHDYYRKGKNG